MAQLSCLAGFVVRADIALLLYLQLAEGAWH